MSSLTIRCGAAHQSKRSRPSKVTLSGYMPRTMPKGHRSYASQTRVQVLRKSVPSNNKFSALAVDTVFNVQRRPAAATKVAPKGCWRKKLAVTDITSVQHQHRQQSKPKKKAVSPGRKLTRSCAYCHDEEHIHHIRDCSILAEKNRKKAEFSRKRRKSKQSFVLLKLVSQNRFVSPRWQRKPRRLWKRTQVGARVRLRAMRSFQLLLLLLPLVMLLSSEAATGAHPDELPSRMIAKIL